MPRLVAGDALAKASKPRMERRMFTVGLKNEKALKCVRKDGSAVWQRELYAKHIAYNVHKASSELRTYLQGQD